MFIPFSLPTHCATGFILFSFPTHCATITDLCIWPGRCGWCWPAVLAVLFTCQQEALEALEPSHLVSDASRMCASVCVCVCHMICFTWLLDNPAASASRVNGLVAAVV